MGLAISSVLTMSLCFCFPCLSLARLPSTLYPLPSAFYPLPSGVER